MAEYPELTELLNLTNLKVVHYQLVGQERINLFVEPSLEIALCPDCKQVSNTLHDTSEPQMIRDLPIWTRSCWLRLTPRHKRHGSYRLVISAPELGMILDVLEDRSKDALQQWLEERGQAWCDQVEVACADM